MNNTQEIVNWMNERPEKLFGGFYVNFNIAIPVIARKGIKVEAFLNVHTPWDDSDLYSIFDDRLLRELAKAKWGDDRDEFLCVAIYGDTTKDIEWLPTSQFSNTLDRADSTIFNRYIREVKIGKWEKIVDENERIAQIYKDILDK